MSIINIKIIVLFAQQTDGAAETCSGEERGQCSSNQRAHDGWCFARARPYGGGTGSGRGTGVVSIPKLGL